MIGYFIIVDFPDKATFLNERELKIVRDRIDADRGDAVPDTLTGKNLLTHLGDFKLWLCTLESCS